MFVLAVADVNSVKLAVHTVLIETALRHAAGYSVVDFVFHVALLPLYFVRLAKFYENRLTNCKLVCYNKKKE